MHKAKAMQISRYFYEHRHDEENFTFVVAFSTENEDLGLWKKQKEVWDEVLLPRARGEGVSPPQEVLDQGDEAILQWLKDIIKQEKKNE